MLRPEPKSCTHFMAPHSWHGALETSRRKRKKCEYTFQGNWFPRGAPWLSLTLCLLSPHHQQIATSPARPAHHLGSARPVRKAWGWTAMGPVCLMRNVPPLSTGMRRLWDASPVTLSASAARDPLRTSVTLAWGTAFFSVSHFPLRWALSFPPFGKRPFTMPSAQQILVSFFSFSYFMFGKFSNLQKRWKSENNTRNTAHMLFTHFTHC